MKKLLLGFALVAVSLFSGCSKESKEYFITYSVELDFASENIESNVELYNFIVDSCEELNNSHFLDPIKSDEASVIFESFSTQLVNSVKAKGYEFTNNDYILLLLKGSNSSFYYSSIYFLRS